MNAPDETAPAVRDALGECFSASYPGVVAFIAVANEGSFARAADRLGIGRSAVSRSVQKLEKQLGARLFSRTTRATSLTSEGRLFYQACRPGVERITQALEEMRDLREGPPRGELRIVAGHAFGRKVVAPLLSGFRACHPDVAVELLLDDGVPDLAADRIDVAFREGALEDSDVIARQLVPMRLLVCASPDYVRRQGLPHDVDALASHACIALRLPNGRLRAWDFRVDGQSRSLVPASALIFSDAELALQAAQDGHGLVQLPEYLVRDALRSGALVDCLRGRAPDDRGHYLCYLSRRHQPKRIRAFIDYMTTNIRGLDLDVTGHWAKTAQAANAGEHAHGAVPVAA